MRWTELRHRMLWAASVGKVRTGSEWEIVQYFPSTRAQMSRALTSLWDAGLLAMVLDTVGTVEPTSQGTQLLYQWDAKHGAVDRG